MRVALLMSGGVDSAVAALVLKDEGYEVFGVHMVHLDKPDDRVFEVSRKLGIDLEILDVRREFKRKIIDYFVREYRMGRTPNPCYFCNREMKFGILFEKAMELGAKLIASGHYARIVDGKLLKAVDEGKDQSYFLSSLRREYLEKILLPIGGMRKMEVLKLAEELGMEFGEESQDVCFLEGDLKSFLKSRGLNPGSGDFVMDGKVVGKHEGYAFYTIGQRRKLGLSVGRRVYVSGIDPKKNVVFLGEKEDVMYDMMIVGNLNFLDDVKESFRSEVKVRSNFRAVGASVKVEEDFAIVKFDEEVFAVTPGQIAVFYDGEKVLMSGVIERGEKS